MHKFTEHRSCPIEHVYVMNINLSDISHSYLSRIVLHRNEKRKIYPIPNGMASLCVYNLYTNGSQRWKHKHSKGAACPKRCFLGLWQSLEVFFLDSFGKAIKMHWRQHRKTKPQQDHSNLLLYSTACVPEVMCDGEAPANPNICHGSEWALIRIFMSFGWLVLLLVMGGGGGEKLCDAFCRPPTI